MNKRDLDRLWVSYCRARLSHIEELAEYELEKVLNEQGDDGRELSRRLFEDAGPRREAERERAHRERAERRARGQTA